MSIDVLKQGTPEPKAEVTTSTSGTTIQAPVTPPTVPATEAEKTALKPKDPNSFGRQFSALSKKEKEIRAREKAVEEREKEQATYSPAELRKRAKLDPMGTLKDLGVDYDYVTNVALDGKVPEQTKKEVELYDTINQLKKEIDLLKGKKSEGEQETSPEEQAVHEYVGGIDTFIEANSEKYKLTKRQNASELVWEFAQLIHAQHAKQGNTSYIPSYDEAAQITENYLREQAEELAKDLGYASKSPESPGKDSTKPQSQGSTPSQTLNNQLKTTVPSTGSGKLLSKEESLQRASGLLRYTK